MSNLLTDKIDHAYMMYVLSNKKISKASSLTKISPVTMKKYVTIKERLDITLFDELNKKPEFMKIDMLVRGDEDEESSNINLDINHVIAITNYANSPPLRKR